MVQEKIVYNLPTAIIKADTRRLRESDNMSMNSFLFGFHGEKTENRMSYGDEVREAARKSAEDRRRSGEPEQTDARLVLHSASTEKS